MQPSIPSGPALRRLGLIFGLAVVAKLVGPSTIDPPHRPDSGKRKASPGEAHEPGRGREADTPAEIPALGWKDILWRTYEQLTQHRLIAVAAGVTYFGLLALFPGIGALVSLYGLFADPATLNDHLQALGGFLPGGALDIIGEQIKRIASKGPTTLGFSFVTGLGVALWSPNAGIKAMFDALNVAYDEKERRGFVKLNLISLAFTVGTVVFLLAAIGGVVVVPVLLKFVGLGDATEWVISIARWPALLAIVVGLLALLYRYGPSRDKPKWR